MKQSKNAYSNASKCQAMLKLSATPLCCVLAMFVKYLQVSIPLPAPPLLTCVCVIWKKAKKIMRQEFDKIGAVEMLAPALLSADLGELSLR